MSVTSVVFPPPPFPNMTNGSAGHESGVVVVESEDHLGVRLVLRREVGSGWKTSSTGSAGSAEPNRFPPPFPLRRERVEWVRLRNPTSWLGTVFFNLFETDSESGKGCASGAVRIRPNLPNRPRDLLRPTVVLRPLVPELRRGGLVLEREPHRLLVAEASVDAGGDEPEGLPARMISNLFVSPDE